MSRGQQTSYSERDYQKAGADEDRENECEGKLCFVRTKMAYEPEYDRHTATSSAGRTASLSINDAARGSTPGVPRRARIFASSPLILSERSGSWRIASASVARRLPETSCSSSGTT